MRKGKLWLFALALASLPAAGLAVAAGKPTGTSAVTASFTATATAASTKACKGADGSYATTRGLYEGTATGDARLSGKLVLRIRSVVNTTNHYGWTVGRVEIRDPVNDRLKATANVSAVNTDDSVLNGFLLGRALNPSAALLASFSASWSADGKTLTGSLGSAAKPNAAILFAGTGCGRADKQR